MDETAVISRIAMERILLTVVDVRGVTCIHDIIVRATIHCVGTQTTGPEIINELPSISHFVAGLGTGGTLMGTGRRLKEHKDTIKIIAAVPEPDDRIQGLRSLEEGFVPPILDLNLLDARMMITGEDSFRMTDKLLRDEGVFAGVSSGAVLAAALKTAQKLEEANIVCLFADGGWKYLSTGLWERDYGELQESVEGKLWW